MCSIADVMNAANISYQTVSSGALVSGFTIDGDAISADLSNSCYDLSQNPDADFAFWFYTINGTANKGGTAGETVSFTEYTLNDGDTVYWQLIAPDAQYGFAKCEPHPQNHFAKAKQAQ